LTYLLDTNVVSELRRTKPHGGVLSWMNTISDSSLYLSAVTMGEIQAGIERTRANDVAKALKIEAWADELVRTFDILPVDTSIFRLWARFMHGKADKYYEDAMIAATGTVHGLMVVTRNTRDFEIFGVETLNPFEYRPSF
jgi:predicted nucleic acid-binding protein